MKLIIASLNKNKIKEIKEMFKNYEILSFAELIEPFDIIEDGCSFKENAIIKAKTLYKTLDDESLTIIADDSGITVPILNYEPGIYSARYAGEGSSDKDNLNKLISKLKKLNIKQTKAYYTSCIAIKNKYTIKSVEAKMYGEVIDKPRGDQGFGYDPIFIPNNYKKTLAELSQDIKNTISHRHKAIELAKILLEG